MELLAAAAVAVAAVVLIWTTKIITVAVAVVGAGPAQQTAQVGPGVLARLPVALARQ